MHESNQGLGMGAKKGLMGMGQASQQKGALCGHRCVGCVDLKVGGD